MIEVFEIGGYSIMLNDIKYLRAGIEERSLRNSSILIIGIKGENAIYEDNFGEKSIRFPELKVKFKNKEEAISRKKELTKVWEEYLRFNH